MRTSSPSRRAAGLLAVTTIGFSTAVLSVTGAASAVGTEPLEPYSFTAGLDADGDYDYDSVTDLEVFAGYCSISWSLYGAGGGALDADGFSTDGGGALGVETAALAGQVYKLVPGGEGGHATQPVEAVEGVEPVEYVADDPDTPEDETVQAVEGVEAVEGVAGAGGEGGTNSKGHDGADGTAVGGVYGGGGGAASEVYLNGVRQLAAFGGDGDGAGGGAGYGDEDNFVLGTPLNSWFDDDGSSGPGSISGTVLPCAPEDGEEEYVTGAPDVKWVDGVERGLEFQLWTTTVDSPVTGVEYSFDGTHWAGVDTENQDDFQYSGTITGLEAGREYSVRFRFTTSDGPTEASAAMTGTPLISAPTDLRAAVGTSSILISWSPPAGADADAVTGYRAWAYPTGAQSDAGFVACPEMDAAARTCLLGVPAGITYSVGVGSTTGAAASLDTGVVVPAAVAPATLPQGSGSALPAGASTKLTAGEPVTMGGAGFLPGSSVELLIYSTPRTIGSAVAADGSFSATVDLPTDLPNGTHHLVAAGVDENGNPRYLVTEVTITGGTTASGLAYTGFSAAPFLGAGALALVAGGGLLVASRRRQQA